MLENSGKIIRTILFIVNLMRLKYILKEKKCVSKNVYFNVSLIFQIDDFYLNSLSSFHNYL